MFLKFQRIGVNPQTEEPLSVAIAREQIAAVMESEDSADVSIIRTVAGRGILVRGTYAQVMAQVEGAAAN